MAKEKTDKSEMNYVWKDRKRTLFGLPWSFTQYRLTEDKFLMTIGFFTEQEDEVRLYRITDITLRRTLRDRIWRVGSIHCCSGDKTSPEFNIMRIKNPLQVKEMLSDMVEKARKENGVSLHESVRNEGKNDLDSFDKGEHHAE